MLERRACHSCGQLNEGERDFCWACHSNLRVCALPSVPTAEAPPGPAPEPAGRRAFQPRSLGLGFLAGLLAAFAAGIAVWVAASRGRAARPARPASAPRLASGPASGGGANPLSGGYGGGTAALAEVERAGFPPLLDSVRHREADVVRKLLQAGFDVNAPGPGGVTAIQLAVDGLHGSRDILRMLVEAGAPQSLLTAMVLEDDAAIRRRIAAKEDAEARSYLGKTPLHLAVHLGRLRAVEALLDAGAPIDPVDRFNKTPLSWSLQGDEPIARLLIERGADLGHLDNLHQAPLYYAASYGKLQSVRLLVAKGADVNMPGQQGFTPLHMAAEYGRLEIAEFLVRNGAELGARDIRGQSAVDHARKGSKPEMVALLVKLGADAGPGPAAADAAPRPRGPVPSGAPAPSGPAPSGSPPGVIRLTEPCAVDGAGAGSCPFTGHHASPVRFAWGAVPGAVRYEILMGLTRCESPVYIEGAVFKRTVPEPRFEAELDGSKPDERYGLHVKAFDAIGAVVGRLRLRSGSTYDFRVPDPGGRYAPDAACYDKLYRWHAPKDEQVRRTEPYRF